MREVSAADVRIVALEEYTKQRLRNANATACRARVRYTVSISGDTHQYDDAEDGDHAAAIATPADARVLLDHFACPATAKQALGYRRGV